MNALRWTPVLQGVRLLPGFIPPEEAREVFRRVVEETAWQDREILMFGKPVMQPRRVAWQGDPGKNYRYSGSTWEADPWSPAVTRVRECLHSTLGVRFNSVLLNLYRDGRDCMGWHRDDEKELGPDPVIASVSLGVSRRFLFRELKNPKSKVELILHAGDLLLMEGSSQELWQHSLPRMLRIREPRVNLTFRNIVGK